MNKFKKLKMLLLILLFILLSLLVTNKYLYGVWNPFALPTKIKCYGHTYYKSRSDIPKTFIDKDTIIYPVESFNKYTGKKLYTIDPKKDYVPKVIYLYTSDNMYQSYELDENKNRSAAQLSY